jgi:alkaline phosphatase D
MAEDRPDLILTLGDYIYEDSWGERLVRRFEPFEAFSLEDYRRRYTQYRLDPDSRRRTRPVPWLVTWDDHEVDNDYVGLTGENELCGGDAGAQGFPARRAAAYQAVVRAHAGAALAPRARHGDAGLRQRGLGPARPLLRARHAPVPLGAGMPECRRQAKRCDFINGRKIAGSGAGGSNVVDPHAPECRAVLEDATRTVLGDAQQRWLDVALAKEQVLLERDRAERDDGDDRRGDEGITAHYSDAWAGYPPARERLYGALAKAWHDESRRADGRHSFLLGERPRERGRQAGRRRARDLLDRDQHVQQGGVLPLNPQTLFHDGQRNGYVRCELRADKLRAEIVTIDDRADPRSGRSVAASFEINAGDPHARRV